MTDFPTLYDYWRSSASYRVRIALNLKSIAYRAEHVDLLTGAHKDPIHFARQPQGLVPALNIDGHQLSQSLAIIEYLDETRPSPALLPNDPVGRHRVRALAHVIAMDIHPICNLSVVRHMASLTDADDQATAEWMRHFIGPGLAAFESMLDRPEAGDYCHGNEPGLADICLVPQVFNARRWNVVVPDRIAAITARCERRDEFARAHPNVYQPGNGD